MRTVSPRSSSTSQGSPTYLEDLRGREEPLRRVLPQLVGSERAVGVLVQKGNRADQPVDVDLTDGDPRHLAGRARTEHGQRQQAGPLGRRQPGDDLLPEELPRGARGRRQDQPHQRRPPGQPVARGLILTEQPGERLDLGIGERERLTADLDDLARGASPSERDRQRVPTGEHEVGMRRQPRRQLTDELLAGRHRRELVQVVDDDADIQRGRPPATHRGRGRCCSPPGTVTSSPDRIADDKRAASSSPGSQATQASMPRGAASLARMAWASAVVLPNPAPATTAVTGTSNRAASASSRCVRTSSSSSGDGGNGARRLPEDCCRLTGIHATCGIRAGVVAPVGASGGVG